MRKLLFMCLICLLVACAHAQTPPTEPAFDNVFMAVSGGKLLPLEHQSAVIRAKAGGFMVARAKASYEISGAKSSVRFHSGEPLRFIVSGALAKSSADPSTLYSLRRLDTAKKSREIRFMDGTFSPFGGSAKTDLGRGLIPVSFSRAGEKSLLISVPSLPPGEYALSFMTPQSLYCFGVD